MLQKYPETTKRFLKAVILGMQFAKHNKQEAIKTGYASGLKGEPDVVNRAYDLFSPGYATDLSVAQDGIQIMLDEDIRAGVVDKNFTLDRVINDKTPQTGAAGAAKRRTAEIVWLMNWIQREHQKRRTREPSIPFDRRQARLIKCRQFKQLTH